MDHTKKLWPPAPGSAALLTGAAWAVVAALAAREFGLLPGCLVGLGALGMCAWRRRAGPWVWAWPAIFSAAAASPQVATPICWPRAGPVAVHGVVLPAVHVDPVRGDVAFRLRDRGQLFLCVVTGAPASFQVLPGDVVRGPARLPEQIERRRRDRMPRVITSHDALQVAPAAALSPILRLHRLATACRLAMQRSLLRAVPGEPGLLLCHLTLGRGPELSSDLVGAHRGTGLSHLLAVSGAHLTMLGWLLGMAFAGITRRSPLASRGFRRFCGATLFFYGAVTGMEPPVFRATVATFVFLIGTGRGRPVPLAAVLALPAILTAILAPMDLLGVSFNLSYVAVIGLGLSGGLHGNTPAGRWIRAPLMCSVWATLCTMPLTLWYFGRIAPWTVLATPLLSPLVAMMLGLALVTACCAPIASFLVPVIATPLWGVTWLYCEAVRGFATLPFAPIFAGARPEPLALCLAATLGIASVMTRRDRRSIAILCVALSVPHFVHPARAPQPGLQLLAVGHGHAAILTLGDGTRVLVDCGSLANPRRAARTVADALLPHRTLNQLVVTHGDFDHAGGIESLLQRVRVERALLPAEMRNSRAAAALAAQGCELAFLAPGERRRRHPAVVVHRPWIAIATPGSAGSSAANRNDHSAWVHVDFGCYRAVLTGDALERSTTAWLRSDLAGAADVLVLPHHGRPHAGVGALLERVRPTLALISSAARDDVTPQAAIARARGSEVLHTGIVGSIHVHATRPPTVSTEYPRPLR